MRRMMIRSTLALLLFLVLAPATIAQAQDAPPSVTTEEGRVLSFDPDWTPRPQEGDVPGYVKETDVDWVDDRLQRMDTGRTFNATFRYRHGDQDVTVYKGTAIRVGEKGEAAWLYDRNQLRWCCAWECEPLAEPSDDNPTGFTPYLNHSDRRFGLLNTPTPKGKVTFSTGVGSVWSNAAGAWVDEAPATAPLPIDGGRHFAMMQYGQRTLLWTSFDDLASPPPWGLAIEHPWVESVEGRRLFTRVIKTGAQRQPRRLRLGTPGSYAVEEMQSTDEGANGIVTVLKLATASSSQWFSVWTSAGSAPAAGSADPSATYSLEPVTVALENGDPVITFAGDSIAYVCQSPANDWTAESLISATFDLARRTNAVKFPRVIMDSPVEATGTPALETAGARAADDSTYVVDTMTLPYNNRYRALFFCSGVDFLPREWVSGWATGDGPDIAVVTTVHGDIWLVDGVDSDLSQLRWKRFASGLYQPMGIKVIGEDIFVLERGQLTNVEDHNQDGTADAFYCFCGDWHNGGGEHAYHTSLETDLDGNFYFHSGADWHTPNGGTVVKVFADGSRSEVYCTGFRHPIGLGVLPDGRITGADQEGNWMPSTRVDIYKPGGFYGDMRAHHRDVEPTTYDGPLCWIPRQLDGSAGGQIFVNRDDFGPLSRHLLHMSFGACKLMLVLMQEHAGTEQAGVIDLGLNFLAGIQRGRFNEADGCLYVAGMDGWQTAAQADGCLQRVRYTGKPMTIPTELAIENGGVRIRFNHPLIRDPSWPTLPASAAPVVPLGDAEATAGDSEAGPIRHLANDPARYHVEMWNYLWTGEYGSKRYSVEHPGEVGQDELAVASVSLLDANTVFLRVPGLRECMQLQVEYDLLAYQSADDEGTRLKGTLYSTVHTTGPATTIDDGELVALIGGTLVEREQRYGYWEHAITAAHPDKQIRFRNLGWSGDTVWAESRGIFDAPEQGYARMLEQVKEIQPSLFVLNYGAAEAWQTLEKADLLVTPAGGDAVAQREEFITAEIGRFITQYDKLLTDLLHARYGEDLPLADAPPFVLLAPMPMEAGKGPNADPSAYNALLARFTVAIEELARNRHVPSVDLADVYDWHLSTDPYPLPTESSASPRFLTENGVHMGEYGYRRTAPWIAERLFGSSTEATVPLPTIPNETTEEDDALMTQARELLETIRFKNELYFHRWRPQNVTYLFLFRKHEQGQNAVEIPQFDPLIAEQEQKIGYLRAIPRGDLPAH
jgi:lysophospholipase L1-like esterase